MATNGFSVFLFSIWYFTESFIKTCIDLFVPASFRRQKDVAGEIVLVTGGGSGLGRAIAVEFAKLGATVVTWDVNQRDNEETVRMILKSGGNARSYVVDVSKAGDVYAAADKVRRDIGDVTILVNNAGIAHYKPVLECSDDVIQKTIDVNAVSHFWLHKAFLPAMKSANHGHVITIASVMAYMPTRHMGAYSSSKCTAIGLHDALQMDLTFDKRTGVKMTLVCPSTIATNMVIGKVNFGDVDVFQPQAVADEIIEGALLNKAVVCIPRWNYVFVLLKNFIPVKYLVMMLRYVKIDNPLKDNAHIPAPADEK